MVGVHFSLRDGDPPETGARRQRIHARTHHCHHGGRHVRATAGSPAPVDKEVLFFFFLPFSVFISLTQSIHVVGGTDGPHDPHPAATGGAICRPIDLSPASPSGRLAELSGLTGRPHGRGLEPGKTPVNNAVFRAHAKVVWSGRCRRLHHSQVTGNHWLPP